MIQKNKFFKTCVVNCATTKLPKLTIKPFAGNAYNWQTFWDLFRTSIHENKNLNNVNRFNYLHNYLEGPAFAAINGFSLTEANYHIAIELFITRFGNKQCIISSHVEQLRLSYQISCPQEILEKLESCMTLSKLTQVDCKDLE